MSGLDAQAACSLSPKIARPIVGGRTPSPMRAMRSIKPGTSMAMPFPPHAPHCTLHPGRPDSCKIGNICIIA